MRSCTTCDDDDHVQGVFASATELAGLVRQLSGFADDPTDRQIETCATYVKVELEAWNDRARIDEEHPPYDELVRALVALHGKCRDLREALSRFSEEPKIITVEEDLR